MLCRQRLAPLVGLAGSPKGPEEAGQGASRGAGAPPHIWRRGSVGRLRAVALLLAVAVLAPGQLARDAAGWPAAPRPEDQVRSHYVLGPEDQLVVRTLSAEEFGDKPVAISTSGYLNLPLVGRLKAAGLTVEQLEAELATRLSRYLEDPKVAVTVVDYRSQPVSVVGAVTTPGVYQLRGGKALVEVLSMAGGLRPEAGHSAKITRRLEWGRLPLAGAANDSSGKLSVAEVSLKSVLEARNAADNLVLMPHDVVTVPRAELVYVMGEVQRPGGFPLNDKETLSALQAVSLAGGMTRSAAPKNARILRASPGAARRTEIPVNLSQMLSGKGGELELQADDILFIPVNAPKNAGLRVLEAAIQTGTGVVIWRR